MSRARGSVWPRRGGRDGPAAVDGASVAWAAMQPSPAPRFGALAVPAGWFVVAASDELAIGEVKPVRYFGRDLVLFRTASGQAQVLDAYCAHLGSHLGFGGVVVDECIRCPFHWWRYDTTGQVVEVPYADRLPIASVGSWPTEETAGVVLVWHQSDHAAPSWGPPELPEHR